MQRNILIGAGILIILAAGSFTYWKAHRYDEPGMAVPLAANLKTAYFAGGCFWCTESDFEKVKGVTEVISGYSGGTTDAPTYEGVSTHTTGHLESVEVRYDPKQVSYEKLVRVLFSDIDPTDDTGSFVDRGESYTSAVFYQTEEEKSIAEKEIERLERSGAYDESIVTKVRNFERFYLAEDYHQDFSEKNPVRYNYYRQASGRDQYLERICAIRIEKNVPCEDLKSK